MASGSTYILRGLNFILPPVGTVVSAIDSYFPFDDDSRVKKILHGKAIALNKKIQLRSAIVVGLQTTACAVLMPYFKDFYTLGDFNGLKEGYGFSDIEGAPQHLDGMLLSCFLAFYVVPWILKAVIRFGTIHSENDIKIINTRIDKLTIDIEEKNAKFNELLKDMQSIILANSGLTHEAALDHEPTTVELEIYRIISSHLEPDPDDLIDNLSDQTFDNRLQLYNLQDQWKTLCSKYADPGKTLLQLQKVIDRNEEEILSLKTILKKTDFFSLDNLYFGLFGMNGVDENPNAHGEKYKGTYIPARQMQTTSEPCQQENQSNNEEEEQQESQDGSNESEEYSQAPSSCRGSS